MGIRNPHRVSRDDVHYVILIVFNTQVRHKKVLWLWQVNRLTNERTFFPWFLGKYKILWKKRPNSNSTSTILKYTEIIIQRITVFFHLIPLGKKKTDLFGVFNCNSLPRGGETGFHKKMQIIKNSPIWSDQSTVTSPRVWQIF